MTATTAAPTAAAKIVTLVTQTRVQPEHDEEFAKWQQGVNDSLARFPGFLDAKVIPPDPLEQVDWVIVQRFTSLEAGRAWLGSKERENLLVTARPWLVGHDDIHLVEDDAATQGPTSVSTVISMRVNPGQEGDYRKWAERIAAAQAQFPGFEGFKVNPPIAGVQDDWVTILQFDTEDHLNAWMNSDIRQKFLEEAKAFSTETHARTVRSGFDQWFRVSGGAALPPVWKQNMLTLLGLYPVVFLFGYFVQTPILQRQWGFPFFFALFGGNVASVVILNWVVPWISRRFSWWLQPAGAETERLTWIGLAVVVALYALTLLVFWRFP